MPIAADDPRLTRPFEAAATRYTDVPFQRAGASGVQLPKVSLGLWQNFGRDRSFDSQREIVLHAFDRGVVHIDLANNYGPPYGSAESTFGAVLESGLARYRDELFVTTKAGYDMWPGPFGDGGSRKYIDGDVPADSRAANSFFLNGSALTDGYLDRIRGIDRIAQEANLSIPQLAIAWVLRDPVVTTAIIGASRTSQIDDAVAASQVTLSDDVVAALDEFAAPVGGSVS
jgi:aryl-alcohol dehydrogenase-like predicted oxidoreductase